MVDSVFGSHQCCVCSSCSSLTLVQVLRKSIVIVVSAVYA